jgi:hypothetical protein
MTYRIDEFALPLPITQAALQTASQFSRRLPAAKAEQVRLNTLAVLVMQDYMQLMDIATDLRSSDSWNPVLRLCADVADLEIAGLGRLECRPVLPAAQVCPVPPESWEDRIGYVVVQLDEANQEALVLGFVPQAETEILPLAELRSPEDLLDHLDALRQASQLPARDLAVASASLAAPVGQAIAHVGQWLQNQVDAGWQTLDALINPTQLSPAFAFRGREDLFRGTLLRAKPIDLAPQLNQPIVLIVEVALDDEQPGQTSVHLQLQAVDGQPLPQDLRLMLLDEHNQPILDEQNQPLSAQANETLEVSGASGEHFTLQISLGDAHITQEFVL